MACRGTVKHIGHSRQESPISCGILFLFSMSCFYPWLLSGSSVNNKCMGEASFATSRTVSAPISASMVEVGYLLSTLKISNLAVLNGKIAWIEAQIVAIRLPTTRHTYLLVPVSSFALSSSPFGYRWLYVCGSFFYIEQSFPLQGFVLGKTITDYLSCNPIWSGIPSCLDIWPLRV